MELGGANKKQFLVQNPSLSLREATPCPPSPCTHVLPPLSSGEGDPGEEGIPGCHGGPGTGQAVPRDHPHRDLPGRSAHSDEGKGWAGRQRGALWLKPQGAGVSSSGPIMVAPSVPIRHWLSLTPLQKIREMEDIDRKRSEELRKALVTS